MRVLVTGAAGQLGRALMQRVPKDVEATALERAALDIADDRALMRSLDELRPRVVINAAAYTAVDQAESDQARAFAINAHAVGALARLCGQRAVRLVHISTDFIFDGKATRPYAPHDAPAPLGVYGASKRQGEDNITAVDGLDWRVVRTAWVYASSGRNFVLTMLRLFRERGVARVVADQVGTPTSAASLAECVWRAALDDGSSDILHYTDAGVASWYDFAVAIEEEARSLGLLAKPATVIPIGTEEYPTPARRPAYSVLDKRTTLARLGLENVHWRVRLREVLRELRP